jgi:hypothetical protein
LYSGYSRCLHHSYQLTLETFRLRSYRGLFYVTVHFPIG